MKSSSWKKIIGMGLSIFVLTLGSVGLTGCETGEEAEGELEEEVEIEEDD